MKIFLSMLLLLTAAASIPQTVQAGFCSKVMKLKNRALFEEAVSTGDLRKAGRLADVSLQAIFNLSSHIAQTWGIVGDSAIELVLRARFDEQDPYEVARLRAWRANRPETPELLSNFRPPENADSRFFY